MYCLQYSALPYSYLSSLALCMLQSFDRFLWTMMLRIEIKSERIVWEYYAGRRKFLNLQPTLTIGCGWVGRQWIVHQWFKMVTAMGMLLITREVYIHFLLSVEWNYSLALSDSRIRITSNPMNLNYSDPDDTLVEVTCFDNPNHIRLPATNNNNNSIDTSTYNKRDKNKNG